MITCGDLPDPVPGPRQALVRVRACAVNPIDTYVRAGTVAMPLPFPFVVGCDLAGEVVAVGPEVDRLRPGMRVWGSNQGLLGRQGTFAELAAVDERWLYPTPRRRVRSRRRGRGAGVDHRPSRPGDTVPLQPGETIFVNGGIGGVGSAVVQIAKVLGARVIAHGRRGREAAAVARLRGRCRARLPAPPISSERARGRPGGVHVWWETQREPDFDRPSPMLAERGRMVIMAGREARPPFPVGPFYVKGCRLLGFVMFKADAAASRPPPRPTSTAGWPPARLRVPIDRVLPLARAAEAHAIQEAARSAGSGALRKDRARTLTPAPTTPPPRATPDVPSRASAPPVRATPRARSVPLLLRIVAAAPMAAGWSPCTGSLRSPSLRPLPGGSQTGIFGLEASGDRFVYVVDRSASMDEPDGRPLAAGKRELLASIDGLDDARQFHVIFYNDRLTMFAPSGHRGRPVFASDDTKREVRRFVDSVTADGGTRHCRGDRRGAQARSRCDLPAHRRRRGRPHGRRAPQAVAVARPNAVHGRAVRRRRGTAIAAAGTTRGRVGGRLHGRRSDGGGACRRGARGGCRAVIPAGAL